MPETFEWLDVRLPLLERARILCNEDPAFHKLGSCDARVGLRFGETAFLVAFEAFECVSVEEIGVDDLRDAEVTIDMPRASWRDLLQRRSRGDGTASLLSYGVEHPDIVRADSPLDALKFDRYHRTLQHFIDKVAAIAVPRHA